MTMLMNSDGSIINDIYDDIERERPGLLRGVKDDCHKFKYNDKTSLMTTPEEEPTSLAAGPKETQEGPVTSSVQGVDHPGHEETRIIPQEMIKRWVNGMISKKQPWPVEYKGVTHFKTEIQKRQT